MSRARILLLFVLAVGLTSWLTMRQSPAAAAASSQNQGEAAIAEYGENTEEVALHRWESNQSRHWRQAVTRR